MDLDLSIYYDCNIKTQLISFKCLDFSIHIVVTGNSVPTQCYTANGSHRLIATTKTVKNENGLTSMISSKLVFDLLSNTL